MLLTDIEAVMGQLSGIQVRPLDFVPGDFYGYIKIGILRCFFRPSSTVRFSFINSLMPQGASNMQNYFKKQKIKTNIPLPGGIQT